MYFPLLNLIIVITEAVITTEKSIAKKGQKLIEPYKLSSIHGRKKIYPKLIPAGRKVKVAEIIPNSAYKWPIKEPNHNHLSCRETFCTFLGE